MNKYFLVIGEWLSIILAVVSSFWLLFGQFYTIQFILLAYVLHKLADAPTYSTRKKWVGILVVSLTILSSIITIWMGYRTEMGFKGGNKYYGEPSSGTIILSLLGIALMVLTLALYSKVQRRAK